MSQTSTVVEGRVPFHHPSLPRPCETWYKIIGQLDQSSTGRPLICLHGGPGACHNYMLYMRELATEHGITLVFYDQVGCGNSTRLPETRLDNELWKPELFMAELDNLISHLKIGEYDLLGQSWGGMLGAQYAVKRPIDLRRLVISNSPASMALWVESCNALRAQLPRDIDNVLTKCEDSRDYENQEYKDAVLYFYKRHLCRQDGDGSPFPSDVMDSLDALERDNTVYFTMNGPSEFTVIGNLKGWSLVGQLNAIEVPTLVLNGEHDEAQAICVTPYAEEIKNSVWKTIEGASHMSHVEKPKEYCEVVAHFLKDS